MHDFIIFNLILTNFVDPPEEVDVWTAARWRYYKVQCLVQGLSVISPDRDSNH